MQDLLLGFATCVDQELVGYLEELALAVRVEPAFLAQERSKTRLQLSSTCRSLAAKRSRSLWVDEVPVRHRDHEGMCKVCGSSPLRGAWARTFPMQSQAGSKK